MDKERQSQTDLRDTRGGAYDASELDPGQLPEGLRRPRKGPLPHRGEQEREDAPVGDFRERAKKE